MFIFLNTPNPFEASDKDQDKPIGLNVDNISCFLPFNFYDDDNTIGTIIYFVDGDGHCEVRETFDEVKHMLEN